jgi:hypothetical protein
MQTNMRHNLFEKNQHLIYFNVFRVPIIHHENIF